MYSTFYNNGHIQCMLYVYSPPITPYLDLGIRFSTLAENDTSHVVFLATTTIAHLPFRAIPFMQC